MKKIKLALFWQILIALVLAVIYGIFFKDYVIYVSWTGRLFMQALKMIIVPLILTSIISGVANIGSTQNLGRLGAKTFAYYISTSLIAILTGLFLSNIIKPGVGAELNLIEEVSKEAMQEKSLSDIIFSIIPENIFAAFSSGQNTLSIIFFAIIFGIFINKVNEKSKNIMSNFFNAAYEVIMKIVEFIISFAPIGIFGLVAKVVSEQDDIVQTAISLAKYSVTVLLGLSIHAFITLPLFLKFIAKVSPIAHFKAMSSALLTAFSTSSSAATLSLTMDCVQNKVGVSNKICGFTLPLGTTVNMDGTALYECVAAMYIAQAYGIDLSFSQQFVIVMTSLLASIGAAAIPMSGFIMLSVILISAGLPVEGLGLILAVDRILDMFRTSVNVLSDTCGAVIVAKSEGEKLKI